MNKTLFKAALFVVTVALTIGVASCESDYSKESNELIQKYRVALTEENLQESQRLSNLLENRELNSKQATTIQELNLNLSKLKKQEAQRKYKKAIRKADEIRDWLENSIGEYAELLKKQNNAATLAEWEDIQRKIVALERKSDEKISERERYLNEAKYYQNLMDK